MNIKYLLNNSSILRFGILAAFIIGAYLGAGFASYSKVKATGEDFSFTPLLLIAMPLLILLITGCNKAIKKDKEKGIIS